MEAELDEARDLPTMLAPSKASGKPRSSSAFPDESPVTRTSNAWSFWRFVLVLVGLCALLVGGLAMVGRMVGKLTWGTIASLVASLLLLLVGAVVLLLAQLASTNHGKMIRLYTSREGQLIHLVDSPKGVTVDLVRKPELQKLQGAQVVSINRVPVFILADVAPATAALDRPKVRWEFQSDSQRELDRLAASYYRWTGGSCVGVGVMWLLIMATR